MGLLGEIVRDKKNEVIRRKREVPRSELEVRMARRVDDRHVRSLELGTQLGDGTLRRG